MTGGSYETECDTCEETIAASARFCPWCGARKKWFSDDVGERLDPGVAVRESYATMLRRARACDEDPAEPRSFEHAFRLLVPSGHVDALEVIDDD